MFRNGQDKTKWLFTFGSTNAWISAKDPQEIKLLAEKLHKSPEKLARQIENLRKTT